MTTIAIGDTHGKDFWEIASQWKFDRFIFLGDYFDNRDDIPFFKERENFEKILAFKRANPDKVTLLIGNHDFHYLRGYIGQPYSGYNIIHSFDYGELLDSAKNEMQVAFEDDKFFFTHAGVTSTWLNTNNIPFSAEEINKLFLYDRKAFGFKPGKNRSDTGDDVTQGPLWVRPASLMSDLPETEKTQVVGHTYMMRISTKNNVIFTDVLATSKEILMIEDGVAKVEKIKQ